MSSVRYSDANHIEFRCIACGSTISFSILRMGPDEVLTCAPCGKQYFFNEEFLDKIRRFENLLAAVHDVKDMLDSTSVAIAFRDEEVKVPYRLLLTRLNTMLTLKINDKETTFRFRVEPLNIVEEQRLG